MVGIMKRNILKALVVILLPTLLTLGLARYAPVFKLQEANAAFSSFRVMIGASAVAGGPVLVDDPHTKAIDFDGSTEGMRNATQQTLGFGNSGTIIMWLEPDDISQVNDVPLQIVPTTGNANGHLYLTKASGHFQVTVYGSDGVTDKQWETTNTAPMADNTKVMIGHSWDSGGMNILINGARRGAGDITKTTDLTISQTDGGRTIAVAILEGGGSNFWNGEISKVSIWNIELSTAQLTAYYDSASGVQADDRIVNGNYNQAAVDALVHQWLLGNDGTADANIGVDYVNSNAANLTTFDNITTADIVTY
jgi:hypothetical protein